MNGTKAASASMEYDNENGIPSAESVRLDVEVRATQDCSVSFSTIVSAVVTYLESCKRESWRPGHALEGWQSERQGGGPLSQVEMIRLGELGEWIGDACRAKVTNVLTQELASGQSS